MFASTQRARPCVPPAPEWHSAVLPDCYFAVPKNFEGVNTFDNDRVELKAKSGIFGGAIRAKTMRYRTLPRYPRRSSPVCSTKPHLGNHWFLGICRFHFHEDAPLVDEFQLSHVNTPVLFHVLRQQTTNVPRDTRVLSPIYYLIQ